MLRIGQAIIYSLLVMLLWGCLGQAPLKTLNYPSEDGSRSHDNLIVFLRGLGGSHHDFYREGFVESIKQRQLPFDMIAPNAHFGYYFAETIIQRLEKDIIVPAKRSGYKKIWLIGVSMGGFGALMYAKEHPSDIEGIYTIAPFLGYKKIVQEITAAGGVRKWEPGVYDPQKDWERMFWHWLKKCAEGKETMPNLYLGFGQQDDFNPAHQLLSELLPKDHIIAIEGGHDIETMKKLWFLLLDADILNQPTAQGKIEP